MHEEWPDPEGQILYVGAPAMESPMPKNRMTFHDSDGEWPPVTIEVLKGDVLRFSQVGRDGRTHVVTFSDRFGARHDAREIASASPRRS